MTIMNNNIQSHDINSMPGILRKMILSSMAKALEEKLSSPNCNLFAVQSELSEIILFIILYPILKYNLIRLN